MILKSVHVCGGIHNNTRKNIKIVNDKIAQISPFGKDVIEHEEGISFPDDVIIYPGLINSHDHLALNTHPILKNRTYNDYIEWSKEDFDKEKKEINSIPFELRCQWGMLKNVIHGFTTVLQHDKWSDAITSEMVDVYTKPRIIHSIEFDRKWKLKALIPYRKKKIIHLAEGKSKKMLQEPHELLKYSLFSKQTILVHGISLKAKEAKKFGGLIWCPNSNIHLYDETASVKELKNSLPILFGTDSTVSSDWDLWKHIKQAKALELLSDDELYNSLTVTPSNLFGFTSKGIIEENKLADIVVSRKKEIDSISSFFKQNNEDILLIIKSGEIVLFDEIILEDVISKVSVENFEKIKIGNSIKYLKFPIQKLVQQIRDYYPNFEFDSYFTIH